MERLLQDSRKLDDTLRTLASVKRELVTLNDIHTTLTQFTDNLKQQHRELESEYSLLKETERKKSLTITEKDTKISELRKNIKKLEEQISQQREESKRLEKSLKEKEEKLKKIFDTLK
ncbi:hypothetical protein EB796_007717 [Bugula neritina]|uniref:Uncharacterized protein n=1 Tax=Bugula neritina TaxID=10212 RepID=A0A7J7K8T6_BUGNE|nr:hypothetical protein EB796_007717 [Bugula neritina]